jgi:hypothetical protein
VILGTVTGRIATISWPLEGECLGIVEKEIVELKNNVS